jgi:hypothetical protein
VENLGEEFTVSAGQEKELCVVKINPGINSVT